MVHWIWRGIFGNGFTKVVHKAGYCEVGLIPGLKPGHGQLINIVTQGIGHCRLQVFVAFYWTNTSKNCNYIK